MLVVTPFFCFLNVVRVVFIIEAVWRGDLTLKKNYAKSFKITYISVGYSPSVPQPCTGQSFELAGSQSPAPVVESGTQERLSQGESEQLPQQQ